MGGGLDWRWVIGQGRNFYLLIQGLDLKVLLGRFIRHIKLFRKEPLKKEGWANIFYMQRRLPNVLATGVGHG